MKNSYFPELVGSKLKSVNSRITNSSFDFAVLKNKNQRKIGQIEKPINRPRRGTSFKSGGLQFVGKKSFIN